MHFQIQSSFITKVNLQLKPTSDLTFCDVQRSKSFQNTSSYNNTNCINNKHTVRTAQAQCHTHRQVSICSCQNNHQLKLRGMAPISLAIIHPAKNWERISEQNGCHTPLISDYLSPSKCLLMHECDIALERYCTVSLFFFMSVMLTFQHRSL